VPPRSLAVLTGAGVLLGYLLNLLRLCVLVCFYRLGLAVPSLQSYGMQVDYAIGVSLFLGATILIGLTVGLYLARVAPPAAVEVGAPLRAEDRIGRSALAPRVLVLAAAGLTFFIPQVRSVVVHYQPGLTAEQIGGAFPATVGEYRLRRKWDEVDANGQSMFVWGRYERAAGGAAISMGVYLGAEDHLVSLSKLLQGMRPEWTGVIESPRANAEPVGFIASFYRDGTTRTMDAETSCHGKVCELKGGVAAGGLMTFVMPRPAELFIDPAERRMPLILRGEWSGRTETDEELRAEFTAAMRGFTAALDLDPLLRLEHE